MKRDQDSLGPSPPLPRSQLGTKPPINLFHHRRQSHQSHHNHTTATGIAALAANAAFTRRQRLRWTQPPPPSPSPPANPPTDDSTNPSPHRLRRNRDEYYKSGGCRYRSSVEGDLLILGERMCYGRGRKAALPEGAVAGVRRRAPDHYSRAEM